MSSLWAMNALRHKLMLTHRAVAKGRVLMEAKASPVLRQTLLGERQAVGSGTVIFPGLCTPELGQELTMLLGFWKWGWGWDIQDFFFFCTRNLS